MELKTLDVEGRIPGGQLVDPQIPDRDILVSWYVASRVLEAQAHAPTLESYITVLPSRSDDGSPTEALFVNALRASATTLGECTHASRPVRAVGDARRTKRPAKFPSWL